VEQCLSQVVAAAQDLFDLYTRLSPVKAHRLALFSDQSEVGVEWPALIQQEAPGLSVLIRGVSCLLANDLAPAAIPLTETLWLAVRGLDRTLAGNNWREPAYFCYLSRELHNPPARDTTAAYRLFAEVLAVYLDILCGLRVGWKEAHGPSINRLRRTISQTGDISSGLATASPESPSLAAGVDDSA
jgi:hypothetical protein